MTIEILLQLSHALWDVSPVSETESLFILIHVLKCRPGTPTQHVLIYTFTIPTLHHSKRKGISSIIFPLVDLL